MERRELHINTWRELLIKKDDHLWTVRGLLSRWLPKLGTEHSTETFVTWETFFSGIDSINGENYQGPRLMGAPKIMSNEAKTFTEVRCAVRFPVQLSVDLETAEGKTPALTHNVSANGVLLSSAILFEVNSEISFSMRMPAAILGTPRDVMIHCRGRVVRSYPSSEGFFTAATIDEYLLTDEEANGNGER